MPVILREQETTKTLKVMLWNSFISYMLKSYFLMLQEKFRVFNQLVLSSHKQNLIDHKAKNVNLYHAYCFFPLIADPVTVR